jgi:GGDEF domain-containing protein
MLKKVGPTTQLQKLPASPGLPEIHHFLKQALEKRGKHVQISWFTPDQLVEFVLDIISPIKGGDPEWRLYSMQGPRRSLLWEYTSCDVLLVYNLTMSSAGEVHQSIQAEGALNVSEFQRDTMRNQDKQYMVQIEHSHMEHGKGTMIRDNSWSRASAQLNGDLANVAIGQLLQSFGPSKSTGKLSIRGPAGLAQVWFEDGNPTHATCGDLVGDDAVMELMSWKMGDFNFEPKVKCDAKTVKSIIETLVAQGIQLLERRAYLKNAGITPDTVLAPVINNLTELDFISRVSRGAPTDIGTLGRFYKAVDGRRKLHEIVSSLKITTTQAMILVYHLMIADCVKVGSFSPSIVGRTSTSLPAMKGGAIEPRNIDSVAIQSVMMALRRAETGMFIYPAFLYFLEQEYFRSYRSGSPLSVFVFEMRYITQQGSELVRQILPQPALLDAVGRISQLKRHVDLLAHYDAFDYAMLLPNTKSSGAEIFGNRLVKALMAAPLAGGIEPNRLVLSFGSASIPEDFLDLSLLLGAADAAMNRARHTRQQLVMYRDMKEPLAQVQ